jgi:hypothetical protein
MIKSVVVPWMVASNAELRQLQSLLRDLGFKDGEGWNDRRSSGTPHLAPLGAIEVIHGTPPATADLIIEVEDVEALHQRLMTIGVEIACGPYDSHWNSRVCVAAIGVKRVAFFNFLPEQTADANAA